MKRIFCTFLLSIFCFLFSIFITAVYAASPLLYFSGPSSDIPTGSEFSVVVLLDSPEPLNAYSISTSYPESMLEVTGWRSGSSIIDVWKDQPVAKNGKIEFSGGSTSPFHGKSGELATINFKAVKEGRAELDFSSVSTYAADGKGTKITPVTKNIGFSVRNGAAPLGSFSGADKKA